MLKLDHFYIKVTNLDRAIEFYQELLGIEIKHREGARWADFDTGQGIYFGIFNADNDDEIFRVGDNTTLALKTNNIQSEFARIKKLATTILTDIVQLTQPYNYYYFQFKDEWGNVWEVAQYE